MADQIERFTDRGLLLKTGRELEAELTVTATGLNLLFLARMEVRVDGERIDLSKSLTYKGIMFSDVPSLAMAIGYTNASWTLKCDLTCEYVAKLLDYMSEKGFVQACSSRDGTPVDEEEMIALNSGYILRAVGQFPRQGTRKALEGLPELSARYPRGRMRKVGR